MNRSVLALTALALALPGAANAAQIVLAPMIGADAKVAANVTDLISSELDFMPDTDGVTQLPPPVAGLNAACLGSTSCLGGIAKANGGDKVVAGSLTAAGGGFSLDLAVYDLATNKIVRRKTFALPSGATEIADSINPIVREIMTGEVAKGAAPVASAGGTSPKPAPAASHSDEDDFAFDPEPAAPPPSRTTTTASTSTPKPAPKPAPAPDDELDLSDFEIDDEVAADDPHAAQAEADRQAAAKAKAEADARAKAEADARAKAEADARAKAAADARAKAEAEAQAKAEADARAKAEADARAKAEADARAKAEADARAKALADQRAADQRAADQRARDEAARQAALAAADEPDDEEFDPSAISFGSASGQIEQEQIDQEIQFAPSTASSTSAAPPARTKSYYDEDEDLDLEPATADDDEELEDLDGGSSRTRTTSTPRVTETREPRTGGTRTTVEREPGEKSAVQITIRGGYSRYSSFNFVTAGGELAIHAGSGVYLIAGAESYNVQRVVPPALQQQVGKSVEWNTIYPFNGGIMYKAGADAVHPYIGADAVMAPYYFDPDTRKASWAIGGRVRGGVDYMVATGFGLNANVSAGAWHGNDWTIIQQGTQPTGPLLQASAGTVIAF